ncbi:hypothetical protein VB780_00340 [Leptolyngbya sp. CCNP1308]|uniref:hypothetical protein n=1 Tax=Leptolyngbya sp. CCNP1308 TaxID=3110255 RepID=UPI002B1FC347|nr:hypothetical protein [Leptolyngbya sp. CCNP1308]MEA5446997.1 hypothetical protein [Leptolyngbya sp. CCNP1308]
MPWAIAGELNLGKKRRARDCRMSGFESDKYYLGLIFINFYCLYSDLNITLAAACWIGRFFSINADALGQNLYAGRA